MSQVKNLPISQQQPASTQIERPEHGFAAGKNQIQNAERHSQAASINEKIEQSCQNGVGQVPLDIADTGKLESVVRRGWLCVVGTAIQFSILIGLILIQYISSVVALPPLIAILFLAVALHPALIILSFQIQALLQYHHHLPPPETEERCLQREGSKEESQIPTIPKINQQACKRANAKTKKMQYPKTEIQEQKHTQLTIKKEPDQHQQQTDHSQNPQNFKQAFPIKRNLLILVKVIQIIMGVTIASLGLFSFTEGIGAYQEAVAGLSIIIYILAVASSFLFAMLLKQISCFLQSKPVKLSQKQPQMEMACSEQLQAKTKISIDQLIQAKPIERKKTFSIEIGLKAAVRSEEQRSDKPQDRRESKSQVQKQAAVKLEIKRSVLKPSKIHDAKPRKISDKSIAEEMMERRKVEINSKKIQYFEYSQISPSQSVVEEKEASTSKLGIKSKLNAQRTKYMRQRVQAEARILSSKVMARQEQAKSQGCLSNPGKLPPAAEEETRIDHFL